jgi:subtilase family serine protease
VDSAGDYLSETAWGDGTGGPSSFEPQPGYQVGVPQLYGLGQRATPDVAYDADPNTGFAVYDSVPDSSGQAGWFVIGGTSAGAPQWSALIALADQGLAAKGQGSLDGAQATLPTLYALPESSFNDASSGYNSFAAGPGYDFATGRGTPTATLLGYLGICQSAPISALSPRFTSNSCSAR